jgi:hypothetical protein
MSVVIKAYPNNKSISKQASALTFLKMVSRSRVHPVQIKDSPPNGWTSHKIRGPDHKNKHTPSAITQI